MDRWIVGNWKMNGSAADISAYAEELRKADAKSWTRPGARMAVCPPFPYLTAVRQALQGLPVRLGAQNVHPAAHGAFTGEVSAGMLKELGAELCIVGHSERRTLFHETDAFIGEKGRAVAAAGIRPILCVGETLAQREAGRQLEVVQAQLEGALAGWDGAARAALLIAYEPVWAIGTGRTATAAQAQEMHAAIRAWLAAQWGSAASRSVPLLYGGSVTAQNAAALFAELDVNGALVGGASLKAGSFLGIFQHA